MRNEIMLSRVADSLYWMSRYLERADHVARQLDVHLSISPEQASEAAQRRRRRLVASLIGEHFPDSGAQSDFDLVNLLTFDESNPNSILHCIGIARDNARQVREQIDPQMWEQINQLYLALQNASLANIWQGQPHHFYHGINQNVYRFQGITDARMGRDQSWHFIQLGRYMERSIETADSINVDFHELYDADAESSTTDQGTYLEWVGFLRGCAAFDAYRRLYTAAVQPHHIVEFLLLNPDFPYSVHFGINTIQSSLDALGRMTATHKSARVYRLAGRLRAMLDFGHVDEIMAGGLGSYLLDIQQQCSQIHQAIYQTYITYPIAEKLPAG
jgi:uncharacterized alpha-E superfamily protein